MTEDVTEQSYEDWLTARFEDARETYRSGTRSENPRRTDIALGKLRAYRDARTEYFGRAVGKNGPDLSEQNWNRVLVGLSVYANNVEEKGDVEHADELRSLSQRIAESLEGDRDA